MKKSQKYGVIGAAIGALGAGVSASPLTIVDLLLGAVILGAIGYFIGKSTDKGGGT